MAELVVILNLNSFFFNYNKNIKLIVFLIIYDSPHLHKSGIWFFVRRYYLFIKQNKN